MTCRACGGDGMIFRVQTQIANDVERPVYDCVGDLVMTTETVISQLGGVDACPVCAVMAEADYRTVRYFRATETVAA